MTNDQYFQPGDKVMRVMEDAPLLALFPIKVRHPNPPEFGRVYCVERCFAGGVCNLVHLVGIWHDTTADGRPKGFPAMMFRRVEEIKLCVRAANHVLKPVEKEETQPA